MRKSYNHNTSKFYTSLLFVYLLIEYSSNSNAVVSNIPLLNLASLETKSNNTEFI